MDYIGPLIHLINNIDLGDHFLRAVNDMVGAVLLMGRDEFDDPLMGLDILVQWAGGVLALANNARDNNDLDDEDNDLDDEDIDLDDEDIDLDEEELDDENEDDYDTVLFD